MKLKQCCQRMQNNCGNCELYALFMSNMISRWDIKQSGDCLVASVNLAKYLYGELTATPSGKKDADAVKLIELSGIRLKKYDYLLVLNLCETTMNSIISRGLETLDDKRRAFLLLGHYSDFINDSECGKIDDRIYIDVYAAYLNSRFQIFHLLNDYIDVIREYQSKKNLFSAQSPSQRELAAHFSASAYLTDVKQYKIASRNVAEQLYEVVSQRYAVEGSLSAADYYILAKFLEHYIQENNIQSGLEAMSPFMDKVLLDNVESGKKALNKTIFHRDMFEALEKVGSNESEIHFAIAQKINSDYGIIDQQRKLAQKKKDVEESKLKHYYSFSQEKQTIFVESGATAHINSIVEGNAEICRRDYTVEEAERILKLILDSQQNQFEELIGNFADALLNSQGELKKLGEILEKSKEQSDSKGVFSKLKTFINDTATTTQNISKLYAVFAAVLPSALEKMPQIAKIIQDYLTVSG